MTTESLYFICQENSLFYVLLIFCAGIVTGMILKFIYDIEDKLSQKRK